MRKMIMTLGAVVGIAGIALSGAALGLQSPAEPASKFTADDARLSASELNSYLSSEVRSVPDNCEVHYNRFTGECSAVVCTSPTGHMTIHECVEFGL